MEALIGPKLTPEVFLRDNQSEEADLNIRTHHSYREAKNLIAIFPCGDARHVLPCRNCLHVRSLGSGGPKENYRDLLVDPRVRGAMSLCHYNGELLKEELLGEEYTCGARKVKSLQLKGLVNNVQGVQGFVARNVQHPHLVYQSLYSAFEIAGHTDRNVLAAAQDHLSGKITPIAIINRGEIIEKTETLDPYLEGQIPTRENGLPLTLPELDDTQIAPEFKLPLLESKAQEEELGEKYADRKPFLQAQMPSVIWMSTLIKPLATRFPAIAGIPGNCFQVGSPRLDLDYTTLPKNGELRIFADQGEYPVTHVNKNYGVEGTDFSTSKTVFVETGSWSDSEHIAQYLLTKPWMRQFLQFPDTQLILAEVISGHAKKIERYL